MNTAAATQPVQSGWFESIKAAIQPENIMKKLNLSREKLVDLGLYAAAGFLVGFLLKKYSRYVVTIILCIVGLAVLQNYQFITITINWAQLRAAGMGSVPTTVDSTLLTIYWEWVKMHVSVVLSFSVGFLVGLKVG